MSYAETAELIEMPFGLSIWVGLRNHILGGVNIASCQEAIFGGKDMPIVLPDDTAVSVQKWLN